MPFGMQPASDMPRHAAQHQTCFGMQPASDMPRHAAQRQMCHSACSPASDVPLGMQPSVRRATRHAAQRQTCHSACSPASDVPLGMQPASDVNVALLGVLLGRPHPKTQSERCARDLTRTQDRVSPIVDKVSGYAIAQVEAERRCQTKHLYSSSCKNSPCAS
jgi:hypothetical protein